MNLTMSKLKKLNACNNAREAFGNQKECDIFKLFDLMIKQEKFSWANWLIVRLLNRQNKIKYAINAALSVIDEFEKQYPDDKRPREAIEAAKKCIKNNTTENRNAAYAAASAVQEPRSSHSNAPSATMTFCACSISA